MDTKSSIKIFVVAILPSILTIFIIFFLIMPQVRKSRVENIPRESIQQSEQNIDVEKYIKENISELSPKKAVLGGKFYVTSFKFIEDDSAYIEYEDGHVFYTANVVFEINDKDVVINDFLIIPTNDDSLTNLGVKLEAVDCLPDQRDIDACIEIYQPVCGQMQVECIKDPCDPIKQTFENSCKACANERVISFTEGECIVDEAIKY